MVRLYRPLSKRPEAMVTDDQVKPLFKLVYRQDTPVLTALVKAGMCETTTRKYLRQD